MNNRPREFSERFRGTVIGLFSFAVVHPLVYYLYGLAAYLFGNAEYMRQSTVPKYILTSLVVAWIVAGPVVPFSFIAWQGNRNRLLRNYALAFLLTWGVISLSVGITDGFGTSYSLQNALADIVKSGAIGCLATLLSFEAVSRLLNRIEQDDQIRLAIK